MLDAGQPCLNLPICAHENAWEIVETIDLWVVDSESVGCRFDSYPLTKPSTHAGFRELDINPYNKSRNNHIMAAPRFAIQTATSIR